jgi:hypothetical protein
MRRYFPYDPSGHAVGDDPGGDISDHNRPRANNGALANRHPILHGGTNADPGATAQCHATAEVSPGPHMNSVFKHALMIDTCTCIYDYVRSEPCTGIENGTCAYHGAWPDSYALRDNRIRMDGRGELKSAFPCDIRKAEAGTAVANSHNDVLYSVTAQLAELFCPA